MGYRPRAHRKELFWGARCTPSASRTRARRARAREHGKCVLLLLPYPGYTLATAQRLIITAGPPPRGATPHPSHLTPHLHLTTPLSISLHLRAPFQGWIWIDVPSSLPIELIDSMLEGDSKALGYLRFLRLFRLLRLLRLLKVGEYIAALEIRFDLNLTFLRIIQMVSTRPQKAHAPSAGTHTLHLPALRAVAPAPLRTARTPRMHTILRVPLFLAALPALTPPPAPPPLALQVLALLFLAHILGCFWFYMAALVGIDPEIPTWVSSYDGGEKGSSLQLPRPFASRPSTSSPSSLLLPSSRRRRARLTLRLASRTLTKLPHLAPSLAHSLPLTLRCYEPP